MAKLVFEEGQRFNQWWLIAILAVVFLFMLRLLIRMIDSGPLNNEAMIALFLGIIPGMMVVLLFFVLQLRTRIDERGITAYFYPFGFSKTAFDWEDIEKVEIVDYSPIKDFGGWGYRLSFSGKKAMNVRGNKGIQLFLKNKKQFLIGTQRPEEAQKIIDNYKNSNS